MKTKFIFFLLLGSFISTIAKENNIEPRTEIELKLTNGTQERFAKVYYINGATTGFDNGFDGETFGGVTNSFDVFTQLVDLSNTKKYQIQSLPDTNITNYIIPVGVVASNEENITFNIINNNLPVNTKVYLEDRTLGRFIRLDEATTTYSITTSIALNGFGRFYLHTSTILLGENSFSGNDVFSNNSNWSNGKQPFSGVLGENIRIEKNAVLTLNLANTIVNNLEIENNATLFLNTNSSLIINGNLIQNGNLTLNSDATNNAVLIVKGAFSGNNLTYNRYVSANNTTNLDGWHLVSAPFSGQDYNDTWISANNITSSVINVNNRAIATYNSSTNNWQYHISGASSSFSSGIGYSTKSNIAGTLSFSGTVNTLNTGVNVPVSSGFNLLGNPYSAYINSQTFLTENPNLNQQIWVFNSVSKNYEAKVAVDAFKVAPGQGFFVAVNSGTTINFDKQNQETETNNTFLKTALKEIKLTISNGKNTRFARVLFFKNATDGFDEGLEGETFGGLKNNLDIFSYLVTENKGNKYQVQSIAENNLENTIIRLGVIASKNDEISFSTENLNIPEDLNIFLEDRALNIFTNLSDKNANYRIIIKDENTTNRFFLHTSNKTLNTDSNNLFNKITIFCKDNKELEINGLSLNKTILNVYNLLGKQIIKTTFEGLETKNINLQHLKAGVYLIHIQTKKGKIQKKIVLK